MGRGVGGARDRTGGVGRDAANSIGFLGWGVRGNNLTLRFLVLGCWLWLCAYILRIHYVMCL